MRTDAGFCVEAALGEIEALLGQIPELARVIAPRDVALAFMSEEQRLASIDGESRFQRIPNATISAGTPSARSVEVDIVQRQEDGSEETQATLTVPPLGLDVLNWIATQDAPFRVDALAARFPDVPVDRLRRRLESSAKGPGLHEPIIDHDVWVAVQAQLDQQRVERRRATNATVPSPLAGMLFDQNGEPLTPGHTSKGSARIRYRYYISNRLAAGLAADHPDAWRLPAEPVERAVRNTLVDLLRDGDHVRALLPDGSSATRHRQLLGRIDKLAKAVGKRDGPALRDLLLELQARIEIGPDSITLSIARASLAQLLDLAFEGDEPDQPLICKRPLTLRKRGVETKLVLRDVIAAEPDQTLIKLVADARNWMRRLLDGEVASIRALGILSAT